ncbi:hypothetical protein CHY_1286 [Carboxydothermus hydrogenoformans Z-2901]|uniref:Uncharacterized protein n=1 Tax=Carboxydothermus hydrogenoformans (strain ATCC BAA-161 / DSM 6008 / Z-2901) TaxID=246194 RepID=Q3ACL4_CARHZ|nr:hypothetical protein CHY_1286 [Carboxydothermus hydrogenoformans Z-2901]
MLVFYGQFKNVEKIRRKRKKEKSSSKVYGADPIAKFVVI